MTYNRHYCYSITFEDGCTYFGSRTCRCSIVADSYTGSPATHAAKWLTGMPRTKQIVSVHATRLLANIAEAKLILDYWAINKGLSLNAAVHGVGFNVQGSTNLASSIRITEWNLSDKAYNKSDKFSKRMTSEQNPAKSDKNRAAQSKRGKIKSVCPHCLISACLGNLSKYHGNNCPSLTSYILATYLATGETKQFKTITLAALDTGACGTKIYLVLSGSRKHSKGWHFKRIMLTNGDA